MNIFTCQDSSKSSYFVNLILIEDLLVTCACLCVCVTAMEK